MRRFLVPSWIVLLSLLVVGPALLPGFVLSYDMVFTPQQTLLPWMLGVDSGLPRAVPQDTVVSLVSGPFPGMLLQKVVLLAIPLLAGFGVRRLLHTQRQLVQLAAVTLIIWNPFVAQRLIIGHWALLLTYAATPWVLLYAARVRAGHRRSVGALVLFVALGSLVPTGGLFMALVVVPVVFLKSKAGGYVRVFLAASAVAFLATWVVPSLTTTSNAISDGSAVGVFNIEAQTWGGPWLSALGLGGIWNSRATLPTGALPWVPVVALLLAAFAVIGFRRLARTIDRTLVIWLAVLAVAGYVIAVLGALFGETSIVESVFSTVPGIGLLRDGQKLLLPLAVLIALSAPLGVSELVERFRVSARAATAAAFAVLILLPFAVMPDLAFGAFGRLGPASYPDSWSAVRTAIANGPAGDAVSLPWSSFRRYAWNSDRVVLDPTPRYMTTTVLTDDRLAVNRNGRQFVVAGDDPRSTAVTAAIDGPEPLSASLPPLGVRWVIEQTDQPTSIPSEKLSGLDLVFSSPGVKLWAVNGDVVNRNQGLPTPIIVVNVLAAIAVLGAAGVGIASVLRKHSHRMLR